MCGTIIGSNVRGTNTGDQNLSVFVASGASHAAGLVPDPGASAGSTKYLREDGTWTAPAGGGAASMSMPSNFAAYAAACVLDSPIHGYYFNETSGTTVLDKVGSNNGTLSGTYRLNTPVSGFNGVHLNYGKCDLGFATNWNTFTIEMWIVPGISFGMSSPTI